MRDLRTANPTPTAQDIADWERLGARGVGIGYDPDFGSTVGGWNGHLVALVEGAFIVDASADQVNRPEYGIVLPGVLAVPLDTPLPAGPSALSVEMPDGVGIEYDFHPRNRTFRITKDWSLRPEAQAVVRAIVAQMWERRPTSFAA